MQLEKLKRKHNKVLGPSALSGALTENSCNRQVWLLNRFKPETKDSVFLEKWKLQHTSALNNLTNFLGQKYPDAKVDSEVQLPTVEFHGVSLFGVIDCLLLFPDGSVAIFDAKTGARRSKDWIQIGIYYLMQKAMNRSYGLPIPRLFSLGIFYDDGKFPPSKKTFEENLLELQGENAIDEVFLDGTRKKLREVLQVTAQDDLPDPQPSIGNCKYCKFNISCPSALKNDVAIVANDLI